MSKIQRRIPGILISATLICGALGLISANSGAVTKKSVNQANLPVVSRLGTNVNTPSNPSLAQLKVDISKSLLLTSAPNLSTSVPPLLSLNLNTDGTVNPIYWECYQGSASVATLPQDFTTKCAYGDTSAKRTIFVTGDSQAGMWLPALNVVGKLEKWKILFLAHPGCTPWLEPYPIVSGKITYYSCPGFQADVAKLIHSILPSVIIPIGLAGTRGKNSHGPIYPSVAQLTSEMRSTFAGYRDPKATIIMVSPMPNYNTWTAYTPATCLTLVKDILKCEYPISDTYSYEANLWGAEQTLASSKSIKLENISPLFCSTKCALFVKASGQNHLVYLDAFHMNRFYSTWIGDATAALLEPQLSKVG